MTKAYVLSYIACGLIFVGLDAVWLSTTGNTLYRPILADIMADKVRVAPAVTFYFVYTAGLVVFAIAPAFASGRWTSALVYGALFGGFAYATYDLTNQATLRNWSTVITLADIAWGAVLSAVASTLGYLLSSLIVRATP